MLCIRSSNVGKHFNTEYEGKILFTGTVIIPHPFNAEGIDWHDRAILSQQGKYSGMPAIIVIYSFTV